MTKLSPLVTLEKDELIFEISEILNAFEFAMRVKIFHRDTFKLLGVSDASEGELRKMLFREQLSYLIGSTRRLELAKYIASNMFYDAK